MEMTSLLLQMHPSIVAISQSQPPLTREIQEEISDLPLSSFFSPCLCHFLWSVSLAAARLRAPAHRLPHPKPSVRTPNPHLQAATNQTSNLCYFFHRSGLIDSTLVTFSNTQRDAVGENGCKANTADFCRLQKAVRWQRLP